MNYPAAAIGSAIGMMIGLLIFASAWRVGLVPRDYDFVHDFGKAIGRTKSKPVAYTLRFVVGTIFHPVIFVFLWGPHGLLGINPMGSAVLSAVILLALESLLFAIVLWTRVLGMPPKELVGRAIIMQTVAHLVLGLTMGLSYALLA